jgi:hypothetical protein
LQAAQHKGKVSPEVFWIGRGSDGYNTSRRASIFPICAAR